MNGAIASGERDMEFFTAIWLGMPVWIWLSFIGAVIVIMAIDLGVLHGDAHEPTFKESVIFSLLYIGVALAFAVVVYYLYNGPPPQGALDKAIINAPTDHDRAITAVELYLTGYIVEYTLAMDNVFVIGLIFSYFAVPTKYQHRVLFWGIIGVVVLRAIMIGLGATIVAQYSWVLYLFAVFLILTGIKLLWTAGQTEEMKENFLIKWLRRHIRVTDGLREQKFFVREADPKTGKVVLWATPLFLCLVMVEFADVIFAVDSVPAIFLITQEPFIVYTSNIFAIIGLRALYFTLVAMVHRFHYLKYALALVLIFIGSKIFLGDLFPTGKVPTELSLGVTFALLIGGVLYSLWATRNDKPEAEKAKAHGPAH
jgi:tellurite resistance protein TerC